MQEILPPTSYGLRAQVMPSQTVPFPVLPSLVPVQALLDMAPRGFYLASNLAAVSASVTPRREDSMQSLSASGTSGIVLLPENMVTKLEAVGEKWGNDYI